MPGELERLREIAVTSKAHWGYDLERVREWGTGLVPFGEVVVADEDGRAVGWAAVVSRGEVCELEHLWVEPEWIGKGVGTRLFEFAAAHAGRLGARRLEWESEPNAVGFYERMGARYLRDSEPTQWGRVVPVMGVDL